MSHKTEYVPKYVHTKDGQVWEYVGFISPIQSVVRVPGYSRCFIFDPDNLDFLPDSGKSLLYYESSTGRYFSAEVLEVYLVAGVPRFKIRICDSRWNNPISVFTVFEDALDF